MYAITMQLLFLCFALNVAAKLVPGRAFNEWPGFLKGILTFLSPYSRFHKWTIMSLCQLSGQSVKILQ